MKRIGIVGLCLAAMFALSAMSASSAFAGEAGICAKVGKTTVKYISKGKEKEKAITEGKYSDKNCQELAPEPGKYYSGPEGKYEWYPYPGPAGTPEATWDYTSKGTTATLETPGVGNVTCAKNKDEGKWLGVKSDVDVVTFEDCTNNVFNTPCLNEGTPGKKGGTIKVADYTTLIDHGEKGPSGGEPAPGEVWTAFSAIGGIDPEVEAELGQPLTAAFECETGLPEPENLDPIYVVGTVSGVTSGNVNVMSNKGATAFGVGKGEQDLTSWTYNLAFEFGPHAATQTATDTIKEGGKIEIKA